MPVDQVGFSLPCHYIEVITKPSSSFNDISYMPSQYTIQYAMPAAAAGVPTPGLPRVKVRFSMSCHYIEIFPKPSSFNGMPSKKESMSRHIIETIPEPNSFNSFSLSNQAQFALVCPSLVFYAWNYIGVIPKSTSSCTCQPGMGTWAGSRQNGIWSRPRHVLAPGLLMLFQCKGGSMHAVEISGLFSTCGLLQLNIHPAHWYIADN